MRNVKVRTCGLAVIVAYADGHSNTLCAADALAHGQALATECLDAIRTGRQARPARAALPLMPCEPREGFVLAERLMLLACRVGMLEGQRVSLADDGDETHDLGPVGSQPAAR